MGNDNIFLGVPAPVGAGRREPRFHSFLPKNGDFSYSVEIKLFQELKIPPYSAVLKKQKPQHMVVVFWALVLQPFSEMKMSRHQRHHSYRPQRQLRVIQPSASGSRYRYGSGCTGCRKPFRSSFGELPYVPAGMPYRCPRSFPKSYRSDKCGSVPYPRLWQAGIAAYIPWGSASAPHR